MNSALVPLPIAVPLFAAALTVVFARFRTAQQVMSVAALVGVVAVSIALLTEADRHDVVTMDAGGWAAPLGITYVVDRLAGIMLVTSSLMLLVVQLYAIGQRGVADRHAGFAPIYLVLASGVSASFITGDMFNLFVAFEMMLAASYVLLTLGGSQEQVRAGMTYVVISLVFSAVFITALALLYAATGTVNMADLAERMPELSDGVRTGFSLLLLLVFGIKAGLFPLFFWLPDSYPMAPGPVTAIFAGLLTKVGVYAIIRTQTLLFPPESQQGTALLIIGGLTMLIGVLGALAQDDLKRLFSFLIVSQIGYMIFGLGLFTVAGVTAVVFYIAQTILVKTNLFLVVGLIDRHAGSTRLSRLGGLVRSAPVIAFCFAVPAMSLAGLPPSAGFAGKFSLIDAGVAVEQWLIVATAIVVGLLTLFSMTKVWSGAFWGQPESPLELADGPNGGVPAMMLFATGVTVALSIGYVVFAGPIFELAGRAGSDLMDPSVYLDAVLGGSGR